MIDRKTGTTDRVANEYSPAFFWSPDGTKLLSLLPEVAAGRVWFRWGVWEGGSSFTTGRFVPSLVFSRDYLQFFEQYAQSMRLWSPDGSAFVYAGRASREVRASGSSRPPRTPRPSAWPTACSRLGRPPSPASTVPLIARGRLVVSRLTPLGGLGRSTRQEADRERAGRSEQPADAKLCRLRPRPSAG